MAAVLAYGPNAVLAIEASERLELFDLTGAL